MVVVEILRRPLEQKKELSFGECVVFSTLHVCLHMFEYSGLFAPDFFSSRLGFVMFFKICFVV